MSVKCEAQLSAKANQLIAALHQAKVSIQLVDVTYNDYNAMLSLDKKQGNIHIYYSPKNRAYKLGLHQLKDQDLKTALEACWETITPPQPQPIQREPEPTDLEYQAYVDGSFQGGAVGYGLLILRNGEQIYQDSGTVTQYTEQQQITGELASTMRVIRWCEANNVPKIQIFYDYNGIEKWATGAWRTHTESTQAYQKFMRSTQVQVVWEKVKSHSGDKWNDIADELAKQGSQQGVKQAPAQEANPLMIELEKVALAFVAHLNENGFTAEYLKIFNSMFARIAIGKGLFDLYNTRKKPLSPVLSNFTDLTEVKIKGLWQDFITAYKH